MSGQSDLIDRPLIWATVHQRLGVTMDDQSAGVRCNLATLAAALSERDPDALAALVEIGADAADRLAADNTPSERQVLQAVMDERRMFESERVRRQFDDRMRMALTSNNARANPAKAVENLLVAVPASKEVLPTPILADAALANVRRLPANKLQDIEATDRERIVRRLDQLHKVVDELTEADREAFHRAIADQLAGFDRSDRRATLISVMRWAPWIANAPSSGQGIATPGQFDFAAFHYRPRWYRVAWWAAGGSLLSVSTVTVLMMLVLWHRDIFGRLVIPNRGQILGLVALALVVAFAAGLACTPSVGRKMDNARSFMLRVCLPSFVGAVTAVAVGALFRDDLPFSPETGAAGIVFFVTQFILQALVIGSVPLALRDVVGKLAEWQVTKTVLIVTVPAVVLASVICSAGDALGATEVVALWPPLVASLVAVAIVATRIELAQWPFHATTAAAPHVVQFGAAVATLLAIVVAGLLLTVAAAVWQRTDLASEESATQTLFLRPHQRATITILGPKSELRIKAHSKNHEIIGLTASHGKGKVGDEVFVLANGAPLCVDDCGDEWPSLSEWLPWLVGGHMLRGSIEVTVEIVEEMPPASGGEPPRN
jgi:hypothetical protein